MRPAFLLLFLLSVSPDARAAALTLVHSGYLLDSGDVPVTSSSIPLVFRLFNVRDHGGTGELLVWESASCDVEIRAGHYTTVLGEACNGVAPLDSSHLPPNSMRYLEVTIANTVLLPRMLIGTVPHSAVAGVAQGLELSADAAQGLALLSNAGGIGAWGRVGAAGLAEGVVSNAHVAANAGIETSKLSGAVTAIADHGLGALATKGTIENADITANAGIETSKLRGAVISIADHGLGALATKGTVENADVAANAGVETSKLSGAVTAIPGHGLGALATKSTVEGADVAVNAAIEGTKIVPSFGAQDITTTGRLASSFVVATGRDTAFNSNLIGTSAAGSDAALSLDQNGISHWRLVVPGGTSNLRFDTAGASVVTMKDNGNVGIGVSDPEARLDVAGPIREQGSLLSEKYVSTFTYNLEADTNWHRLARMKSSDFAFISSSHNAYPIMYLVAHSMYPQELVDQQPHVTRLGGFTYPASEVTFRRVVVGTDYYLEIKGTSAHGKAIRVSGNGLSPL